MKPLLSSERAALRQSSLATRRLAEDRGAALADDNSLGVREYGGDGEAAGALDVHEERSGAGHQSLPEMISIIIDDESSHQVGCVVSIVPSACAS